MRHTQRIEKSMFRRTGPGSQAVSSPAAAADHSEPRPLPLRALELRQVEAFLRTLSGPVAVIEPAHTRRSH